jgi:hypothetical protein
MKRIRIVGLCLTAMFVFGAVASASASADEFFVNGTGIGANKFKITGKQVAGEKGEAKLRSEIGSTKVVIICVVTKVGAESEIFNKSESKGKIEYSSCKLENAETKEILTACTVVNPIAKVKNILEGTPDKVKFSAEGANFTEITIEGSTCALKVTKVAVTGTQVCELPEGGVEKVAHIIQCLATGSTLKFGTKAATYEGDVEVELTTKESWSAQ